MKFLSRAEELVLLTLWKMKEEPYGINILKYITDMTNKYWSIGSIYVPLDRLETKGYIISEKGDATPERGGKAKRFYKLTDEGKRQLSEIQKLNESLWKDIPDLSTN